MRRHFVLLAAALAWSSTVAPASAKPRETVNRTLVRLAAQGAYDPGEVARWKQGWRAARRALRRLRGD